MEKTKNITKKINFWELKSNPKQKKKKKKKKKKKRTVEVS